jgi:endonuclease/exonuclease/phosphatase family metal-dependent hydrolase
VNPILLTALVLCSCVHSTRTARIAAPGEPQFKVTTYNLNYGLAGEPDTLAAIAVGSPDVVFLQETTARWEAEIRREYAARYPYMSFHHCCGAGGLGVISKVRLTPPEYLDSTSGWFPALRVVLNTQLGPVQVLSVHLHPPVSESGSFVKGYFTTTGLREAELREFLTHLDPELPTLVMGDLNEPDGKAVRCLQDLGFRSSLPEFAPAQKTWRWKLPIGALSSRLDHIFYNRRLEPLSVDVLDAGRSDHLPITAVFAAPRQIQVESTQRTAGSISFSP